MDIVTQKAVQDKNDAVKLLKYCPTYELVREPFCWVRVFLLYWIHHYYHIPVFSVDFMLCSEAKIMTLEHFVAEPWNNPVLGFWEWGGDPFSSLLRAIMAMKCISYSIWKKAWSTPLPYLWKQEWICKPDITFGIFFFSLKVIEGFSIHSLRGIMREHSPTHWRAECIMLSSNHSPSASVLRDLASILQGGRISSLERGEIVLNCCSIL